jgi:hypothetical protein
MDDRTQRAVAYYEKHLLLVKEYAQKKREQKVHDEPPKRSGRPALSPEERTIRRRASRIAYYNREKAKAEQAV